MTQVDYFDLQLLKNLNIPQFILRHEIQSFDIHGKVLGKPR